MISRFAHSLLVLSLAFMASSLDAAAQEATLSTVWSVPDVGALPYDAKGQLVRRGRDLITATYAHIGPDVRNHAKRYAGNNLACGSCHLDAGTRKFALPIFGLTQEYPRYSGRTGAQITLEERVDQCMTRSMNGRALPHDSPEMRAIIAYIDFLSTGVAKGRLLSGHGAGDLPELDRAADPERGRPIYEKHCVSCHNSNGQGVRRSIEGVDLGYAVPPLWGSDSFNDGAGMGRLITAASFIHSNMPRGVDHLHPELSAEEAWDVAAFMLSQPRPHKKDAERDFPDLTRKPVDAPYGPYADGFSERQHKYGPFAPIRAKLRELEASKADGSKSAPRP